MRGKSWFSILGEVAKGCNLLVEGLCVCVSVCVCVCVCVCV